MERGETVVTHISDTAKDSVQVEPTFRELTIKNYIHQAFIGVAHVRNVFMQNFKWREN